jgi:hypothetical protein
MLKHRRAARCRLVLVLTVNRREQCVALVLRHPVRVGGRSSWYGCRDLGQEARTAIATLECSCCSAQIESGLDQLELQSRKPGPCMDIRPSVRARAGLDRRDPFVATSRCQAETPRLRAT